MTRAVLLRDVVLVTGRRFRRGDIVQVVSQMRNGLLHVVDPHDPRAFIWGLAPDACRPF